MKIMLIVPDGVAIRNYIYSNFIKELKNANFEVILYHQVSESAINEVKDFQKENLSKIVRIPEFRENLLGRIIKESIVYARLIQNSKRLHNETIMLFWNKNQKGFKRQTLLKISEFFGFIISKNYPLILKFEKIHNYVVLSKKKLKQIDEDIARIKPDYILNLHQRAAISTPIIAVAEKRKIRTGTVIFSWDNMPKARLVSRYNNYFVWSDIMKTEMNTLYPEIDVDTIKVTGTPQFEFYFNKDLQNTKADFFNEYGLDISKKTICYSANDTSSPYEPIYLEHLCEEVSQMELQDRPQILFRNCPVDKSSRFDLVLEKYKEIVFAIEPDWKSETTEDTSFVSLYPKYNDNRILLNTVLHSDLVINFGSTMAHDFAIYDKPCLYINYNPVEKSIFRVEDGFQFQHFRSMLNLDAVGWINSKSEFIEKISLTLKNPALVAKDRKKWMEIIVKHPIDNNSKNLVNEISKLCTSVL